MPFLNNQLSFQDLFIPPEGYKTKFVELTTFSISLGFATLIPTLIFAGNNNLISDELNAKRIMKSPNFEDTFKKFHIFYDGKPKMDTDATYQFQKGISQFGSYILNNNAHGIKDSGLFHPKIMVFEFTKDDSKPKFRVFIGSRNFTYSNYVEAGVCIDICCDENHENSPVNPIGTKLEAFFSKCDNGKLNKNIDWENLKTGKLYLGEEEISDIDIHFSDLNDLIDKDLVDCKEARIVSMNPTTSLFENYTNVSYVANNNDLLKDENKAIVNDKKMAYLVDAESQKPLPLHAKIYAMYKNDKFITWIGSANCSANGLNGKNTEVMLRIESNIDTNYSFPIKTFAATFSKDINYSIKPLDKIEDVDDEENPLTLPATIIGEFNGKTFTLNIQYKGSEKPELKITPFGLGSAYTQIVTGDAKITFEMNESNFTNIFQVACDNAIYRVVIDNVSWHGVDIPKIIEAIEVDPIKSLKELVPICKNMNSANQDAYERILAHKHIDSPKDFNNFLDIVLNNIQVELQNNSFINELQTLQDLCNKLKGELT